MSRSPIVSLFLLVYLFTATVALAQPGQPRLTTGDTPVAAELQAEIERLQQAPKEDTDAVLALKLTRKALDFLKKAKADAERTASYRRDIDTAAEEEKRLQRALQQLPSLSQAQSEASRTWDQADLDKLVSEASRRRARLASAQSLVSDLQNELERFQSRPTQRGAELTAAKQRLGILRDERDKLRPGSLADTVPRARSTVIRAESAALKARLEMLRLEEVSESTRRKQAKLRSREAQRRLSIERTLLGALDDLIDEWRYQVANQAKESTARTETDLAGEHPLLRSAATENARLGQQLSDLANQIDLLNDRSDLEKRRLTTLDTTYRRVSLQLRITGQDAAVGRYLFTAHEKLNHFLNLKRYESKHATHRQDLGDARLSQLELDDTALSLRDPDQMVADTIAAFPNRQDWDTLQQSERGRIAQVLQQLFERRRELIKKLTEQNSNLIEALNELIQAEQQVLDKSRKLKVLIDQNLWFLPSNAAISPPWFAGLVPAVTWLVDCQAWSGAALTLLHAWLGQAWWSSGLTLLAAAGLWAGRSRLKQHLADITVNVGNFTRDRFALTNRALLVTAALSAAVPLLTLSVAIALTAGKHPKPDDFGLILGRALLLATSYLFVLLFLKNMLCDHGLAQVHFGWRNRVLQVVRRNLSWYIPAAFFAFLVTGLTRLHWVASGVGVNNDHLGRAFFVLLILAVLVFFWRVLHPRRYQADDSVTDDRRHKLKWLLLGVITVVNTVLAVAALAGYYYTALLLFKVFFDSVLVVIGVYLLYALALRWFMLAQRRLDYQRRREQAAKEAKERAKKAAAEHAGEALPNLEKERGVDLKEVSTQVQRFLGLLLTLGIVFGLGWTWQTIAPVLGSFDNLMLWQHQSGEGVGAELVGVTLQDLLVALAVVAFTIAAARNLPGMLEVAYLERVGMKSGNRYAFNQILRYGIYTAGIVWTLRMVGVRWGDIQWLVAAMGVGLGFGLKEIFSNFISGLIILFERPIRVGDTITVGDITGQVARIRIRASTITDWDNRELVIPNQKLITDSIINWTLSDPVTRVTFRLGVAYGSDPEQVQHIILEAVHATPLVLDEPMPSVFFVGFGDNALEFEVRAFVSDRFNRTPLRHELHMALNKALRENGIAIPFPQRDVHLVRDAPSDSV